jgi:hypothetical protein
MKLVATGALLAVGCEAHCQSGGYLHFSLTSTETTERSSRKRSGLALDRPVSTTGASRRAEVFCGPRNTRKDAKFSEPEIDRFLASWQEALVFQSRIMAEVHEHTQLAITAVQIPLSDILAMEAINQQCHAG